MLRPTRGADTRVCSVETLLDAWPQASTRVSRRHARVRAPRIYGGRACLQVVTEPRPEASSRVSWPQVWGQRCDRYGLNDWLASLGVPKAACPPPGTNTWPAWE